MKFPFSKVSAWMVLLNFAIQIAPVNAQDLAASQMMLGANLLASETETCASSDPNSGFITFQLNSITLSNPIGAIDSIDWVILRNGVSAPVASYALDASTGGPNLDDWNNLTTLAMVPLTNGVFEVTGTIYWPSLQQEINPAPLAVGTSPQAPIFSAVDSIFCDAGGQLDVQSAVLTPNGISTDLCLSIIDNATGNALTIAGVDCETSGANPNVVNNNILVNNLASGCYTVNFEATNACGTNSTDLEVHVLATPSFALSLPPICEGEVAIATSNFNSTSLDCDNNPPTVIETWTQGGAPVLNPTPNQFSFPAGELNHEDVICQSIVLDYEMEACSAQACASAIIHEAAAIEWLVTYPVNYPPVCSGDSLEITILSPPASSQHEWLTSPLPSDISSSGINFCTGISIDDTAAFSNIQAPGIEGIIRRTTCHYADGYPVKECVTDTIIDVDVAPKPTIAWVDSVVTTCAYDESAALSIVIQNEETNPSPWFVTWVITNTTTGISTNVVQGVSSAQVLNNETLYLDLPSIADACFNGSVNQINNFDVVVSAQNLAGCESISLDGSLTLYNAPQPTAVLPAVCEGDCPSPINVNSDGGLQFQWFLDTDGCDDIDPIPTDGAGILCPIPMPWDLTGTGFSPDATGNAPEFCDANCTSEVGMRLQQTWILPNVPDSSLSCISSVERFDVEIVPYPEMQVLTESTLCSNDSEFDFFAVNCNASDFDDTQWPCTSCPSPACEFCLSDFTNVTSWGYSIDGGSTFNPQFPNPPLFGDAISVPAAFLTSGLNPIIIKVQSHTGSNNFPALVCATEDTFEFNWYEAPTIPEDGILQPDFLCPGTEFEFDVLAENQNGSNGDLCYQWTSSSGVTLGINGPPCSNDAPCGVIQGAGVLNSLASVTLPIDANPNDDVCLDLTITDDVGCQVETSFCIDVHALPNLDGISVTDAFMDESDLVPLNPSCLANYSGETTPSTCAGINAIAGEESTIFCGSSDFLISPIGASGEFADTLSNGTLDYNQLNFNWEVFDLANGGNVNLITNQDTCGYGQTPALDCIDTYNNSPAATLSVYVTVSENNGCSAEFQWVDTLSVFPAPCMELTSDNKFCEGESLFVVDICGAQNYQHCCPADLWQVPADPDGCAEISISVDCLNPVAGSLFNTDPIYGSNDYTLNGESLTCWNSEVFQVRRVLGSGLDSVIIEDDSFNLLDSMACEGASFTMTTNPLSVSAGSSLTYEWLKFVNGVNTEIGDGDVLVLPAETDGGDCDSLTTCEGMLVVTREYESGVVCPDIAQWKVFVRPTPTFNVLSEALLGTGSPSIYACEGDSIEICAERSCGVADGEDPSSSWTWDTTDPECETSSVNALNDTICWTYEALFLYPDGSFSPFKTEKQIKLTDSYGCFATQNLDIEVFALPDLEIEQTYVCEGDTIDIEVNGADVYQYDLNPSTGTLSFSDPIFAPGNAVTGDSLQQGAWANADSGDCLIVAGIILYDFYLDTLLECSAIDSVKAVVYPLPVIEPDLSSDGPYCEEDSLTFCDLNLDSDWVPPVYSYQPSTGDGATNVAEKCFEFELQPNFTTLNVTKTLNYLEGDITTTCAVTWDTALTVTPNPIVSLSADAGICQNESTLVLCDIENEVAGSTYLHTWQSNDGGDMIDVDADVPGFITQTNVESTMPDTLANPDTIAISCEVEIEGTGCSAVDTLIIEVLAVPSLVFTSELPDSVCSPTVACAEVGILNDLDPEPTTNIVWSNPNPSPSDNCFQFQNNTACPVQDEITVTVQFVHTLMGGGTLICSNSLSDSLIVSPTPDPEFLLAAPQACFDEENGNCIEILHDLSDYTLCEDDAYSFNWFVTPTVALLPENIELEDANEVVPSICMDAPGEVEIILEIENAYGCSQTTAAQTFIVRELPTPNLTFTQADGICMPTTVEINATSIGTSEFSMSIEDYGTFPNFSSPLVLDIVYPGYRNVDFVVERTYTAPWITGYDALGNPVIEDHEIVCAVDTTYLAAFEGVIPPVAQFSVLPDTRVDQANALIQFVNESQGQVLNLWNFGAGFASGSDEVNPQYQYTATGEYLVELAVVNDRGCTDYAEQLIEVYADVFMYVPNAFTPATSSFADNLNDSWFPSIEGINVLESYEVCVFNRTGHRVWCSQDPSHPPSEQWNGTGPEGTHLVKPGTYTWRIEMKKKNGQGADVYTGAVNVIR